MAPPVLLVVQDVAGGGGQPDHHVVPGLAACTLAGKGLPGIPFALAAGNRSGERPVSPDRKENEMSRLLRGTRLWLVGTVVAVSVAETVYATIPGGDGAIHS